MAAKEMKIRKENKSCAGNYFKKAADNYDQMLEAFHAENWNATATLAVQCAISTADAICVYEQGVRSISPNHLDVCELVAKLPIREAQEKAKQLRKVIMRKSMVQYESRNANRADANDMLKVTTRVYQWARMVMEN